MNSGSPEASSVPGGGWGQQPWSWPRVAWTTHCPRDPGGRCEGGGPCVWAPSFQHGAQGCDHHPRGAGALALGPQALLGPLGVCVCFCVLAGAPSDPG